ncbi:hypothetical protein CSUI_004962 [Cystoisospora suis]|uniref:Uncharacterized protein n=1 Tax=Cystoisospora suis TaxID=483139 RepID=A0A2C6KYP9_9APIC|nr:hypothetical protein CSUI_004962 [Cystoisospora suis]
MSEVRWREEKERDENRDSEEEIFQMKQQKKRKSDEGIDRRQTKDTSGERTGGGQKEEEEDEGEKEEEKKKEEEEEEEEDDEGEKEEKKKEEEEEQGRAGRREGDLVCVESRRRESDGEEKSDQENEREDDMRERQRRQEGDEGEKKEEEKEEKERQDENEDLRKTRWTSRETSQATFQQRVAEERRQAEEEKDEEKKRKKNEEEEKEKTNEREGEEEQETKDRQGENDMEAIEGEGLNCDGESSSSSFSSASDTEEKSSRQGEKSRQKFSSSSSLSNFLSPSSLCFKHGETAVSPSTLSSLSSPFKSLLLSLQERLQPLKREDLLLSSSRKERDIPFTQQNVFSQEAEEEEEIRKKMKNRLPSRKPSPLLTDRAIFLLHLAAMIHFYTSLRSTFSSLSDGEEEEDGDEEEEELIRKRKSLQNEEEEKIREKGVKYKKREVGEEKKKQAKKMLLSERKKTGEIDGEHHRETADRTGEEEEKDSFLDHKMTSRNDTDSDEDERERDEGGEKKNRRNNEREEDGSDGEGSKREDRQISRKTEKKKKKNAREEEKEERELSFPVVDSLHSSSTSSKGCFATSCPSSPPSRLPTLSHPFSHSSSSTIVSSSFISSSSPPLTSPTDIETSDPSFSYLMNVSPSPGVHTPHPQESPFSSSFQDCLSPESAPLSAWKNLERKWYMPMKILHFLFSQSLQHRQFNFSFPSDHRQMDFGKVSVKQMDSSFLEESLQDKMGYTTKEKDSLQKEIDRRERGKEDTTYPVASRSLSSSSSSTVEEKEKDGLPSSSTMELSIESEKEKKEEHIENTDRTWKERKCRLEEEEEEEGEEIGKMDLFPALEGCGGSLGRYLARQRRKRKSPGDAKKEKEEEEEENEEDEVFLLQEVECFTRNLLHVAQVALGNLDAWKERLEEKEEEERLEEKKKKEREEEENDEKGKKGNPKKIEGEKAKKRDNEEEEKEGEEEREEEKKKDEEEEIMKGTSGKGEDEEGDGRRELEGDEEPKKKEKKEEITGRSDSKVGLIEKRKKVLLDWLEEEYTRLHALLQMQWSFDLTSIDLRTESLPLEKVRRGEEEEDEGEETLERAHREDDKERQRSRRRREKEDDKEGQEEDERERSREESEEEDDGSLRNDRYGKDDVDSPNRKDSCDGADEGLSDEEYLLPTQVTERGEEESKDRKTQQRSREDHDGERENLEERKDLRRRRRNSNEDFFDEEEREEGHLCTRKNQDRRNVRPFPRCTYTPARLHSISNPLFAPSPLCCCRLIEIFRSFSSFSSSSSSSSSLFKSDPKGGQLSVALSCEERKGEEPLSPSFPSGYLETLRRLYQAYLEVILNQEKEINLCRLQMRNVSQKNVRERGGVEKKEEEDQDRLRFKRKKKERRKEEDREFFLSLSPWMIKKTREARGEPSLFYGGVLDSLSIELTLHHEILLLPSSSSPSSSPLSPFSSSSSFCSDIFPMCLKGHLIACRSLFSLVDEEERLRYAIREHPWRRLLKAIQSMQERQQENLLKQPLGRYPRLPVKMNLPQSLKAHPSKALQSAVHTHRGLQELLTGIAVTHATVGSLLRQWRIDTSGFIEKIRKEENEEERASSERCLEEEKRERRTLGEGRRRENSQNILQEMNEERSASSLSSEERRCHPSHVDRKSKRDEEEDVVPIVIRKLRSLLKRIQKRIRNANGVYRHQREIKVQEIQEKKRDERERRKVIETLLTSIQ